VPILAKFALLALGMSVMKNSNWFMVFFFLLFGCVAEDISSSVLVADSSSSGDTTKVESETKVVRLQQADVATSADQSVDTTPVDVPIDCTISCDDGIACTDDTCDTTIGQCVNTSKGWDCWPCESDEDCKLGMKTCQNDDLIHKDGYDICLPNKTCLVFHETEKCPDDGNPCTKEACTTEDDAVFCESTPIVGCKP